MLRTDRAITLNELQVYAPSVFAAEAHDSRSDRYTYIPTIKVLEGLQAEGWSIYGAMQSTARTADRRAFTKHMLRLRRPANFIDGAAPEVVLINSHDGSSSYRLLAGMIRYICTNGLIMGDKWSDVRIMHKGNIVDNVIEGTYKVVDNFDKLAGAADTMKQITLNRDEQQAFAEAALPLRFDMEDGRKAPVRIDQVLYPRRSADQAPDLWTTFNRVQENLVRGGLPGRSQNPETGRVRRASTREVGGIDGNVKLNQALFTLAEKMAELKGVALPVAA